MMKKLLAILLALTLVFSLFALTACSSSDSDTSDEDEATSAEEEAAVEDEDEAPAEEEEEVSAAEEEAPAEEETSAADVEYPTLNLHTATDYNADDMNGLQIAYFCDYVNEHSGGAITIDCYWGGSFCAAAEVWDYVEAGDLEVALEQPVYLMASIPLAFGTASWIDNQNAVDSANAVIYGDETGPMVEAQAADINLYLLGHDCAGSSVFLGTKEMSTLDEATKLLLGSPINLDLYAELGFGTTEVEPADMYDSLSRGVCDAVAFSAGNIITQGLTEVAPHVLAQRAYFTNQLIGVNLDFWNSLDEATQDLFVEAAMATSEFSVEQCNELDEELVDLVNEIGGSYYSLTEEEAKDFNYKSMKSNADMLRGFAENLDCVNEMEAVIDVWAEALQQDPF